MRKGWGPRPGALCPKVHVPTEFFFCQQRLRDKTPRMRSGAPSIGRRARWLRSVLLVCGLTLSLGSSACVVVKPYQRELLSERCMAAGFGDLLELQFRGHWEGSRHGSEGGFTTAGGGCGCN